MEAHLNYPKASPHGFRTFTALDHFVEHCALDPLLLAPVQLHPSQINGRAD